MKQTIPFTKDITFNTKISEITSISLEHDFNVSDDIINGNFIISGDYKIHDASIEKENFNYKVPFDIDLTSRYNVGNCSFEIDDFYYEIIDNNTMRCHIEVSLDSLEEKIIEEESTNLDTLEELNEEEKLDTFNQEIEEIIFEEEEKEIIRENENHEEDNQIMEEDIISQVDIIENNSTKIKEPIVNNSKIVEEVKTKNEALLNNESLKKLFDEETEEVFSTYKVYIIRDNDNIETIMTKYGVTKETINIYNDIDNIKLNDKIIIPCMNE